MNYYYVLYLCDFFKYLLVIRGKNLQPPSGSGTCNAYIKVNLFFKFIFNIEDILSPSTCPVLVPSECNVFLMPFERLMNVGTLVY